ncbi:MAG: hypothetical protein V7L25_08405 [Nostoc sp.]
MLFTSLVVFTATVATRYLPFLNWGFGTYLVPSQRLAMPLIEALPALLAAAAQ